MCPWGYYGEQCNETCTCSTELCHDVLGCVTAGEQLYKIFVIWSFYWHALTSISFNRLKSTILMNIWQTVIVFMYFWYTVCFPRFLVLYFLIKFFVSFIISIRTVNIIQTVLILANIFLNHFLRGSLVVYLFQHFRFTELYQHQTGIIAQRLAELSEGILFIITKRWYV